MALKQYRSILPVASLHCFAKSVHRLGIILCLALLCFSASAYAQKPVDSLRVDSLSPVPQPSASTQAQSFIDSAHTDSLPHPTTPAKLPLIVTPFKRPLAVQNGPSISYSNSAIRYYGSPLSMPAVIDESGTGYALVLGDQGYGRETFLRTSRYNEPLVSTFINGVLPLNDPITGVSMLNYFPVELASQTSIISGGDLATTDHAASDVADLRLEQFRAPIPYSRIHYTQELGHGLNNFEGLFSINPSDPLNLTFAAYRRSSGSSTISTSTSLNPRTDMWWVRAQGHYQTKKTEAGLLLLYNSAFTGSNGGIEPRDSITDLFDENLSPVKYTTAIMHRTRLDILGQLGFGLLSEHDPTQISGYLTLSSRRFLYRDSSFPGYVRELSTGNRFGATFLQPASLSFGTFSTRAQVRGDLQILDRTRTDHTQGLLLEKRYSVMGSDSLSIGGAFGLSANGYFRTTISQLSIAGDAKPSLALAAYGIEASARLSKALSLTAQQSYARDRSTFSPDPLATYELQNIGLFGTFSLSLGKSDSLSITIGYLNRTEPEGIVLSPVGAFDTLNRFIDSAYQPLFSSTPIHSSGINGSFNLWVDKFRISAQAEILPSISPLSAYTVVSALRSDLSSRITGSAGLFYESEIAEGNLRLSLGSRVRYYNHITPAIGYDPASEYYVYQGLVKLNEAPYTDSRLTDPVFMIDILASALIDQRAYVNFSFLNILSKPYFNTQLYPRDGFVFRIDVSWAFLD